jgi:type IV pilus assembly protein PilB
VGCSSCSHTGYRGRLALHEVMTVGEEIERLAVGRASAATIAKAAQEGGMETLREDGLAKVISGDTSLEELFRVVT